MQYEPIKEIYKKSLQAFKNQKVTSQLPLQQVTIDNRGKFVEVIASFDFCKDAYIKVIVQHIEDIYD